MSVIAACFVHMPMTCAVIAAPHVYACAAVVAGAHSFVRAFAVICSIPSVGLVAVSAVCLLRHFGWCLQMLQYVFLGGQLSAVCYLLWVQCLLQALMQL